MTPTLSILLLAILLWILIGSIDLLLFRRVLKKLKAGRIEWSEFISNKRRLDMFSGYWLWFKYRNH